MTDLRDARFQKALLAAPDADARPAPAVANAIRAAARNALPVAVPRQAPAPWWQRLWQSTGSPRAPWNAAFATLLVAVLVTVLWVREPIPDARPIAISEPPVPASMPAPAPTMPKQATKDAAASSGNAAGPPPAAKSAPAEQTRSAAATARLAPVAPLAAGNAGAGAAPPVTTAEQAPAPSGSVAQPAAPLLDQTLAANKATVAVAAEAQSRAARRQKEAVTETPSSRSDMARAAAPLAVVPMMVAPVAPAPMVALRADLTGLEAWMALRVQMEEQSMTLDRAQGQRLYARMVRLVRQTSAALLPPSVVPATEPALRLTVLSQGQTLAVMGLWDGTVLWHRPAQADVIASVSAADAQALLQLARQALAADIPD